MMYLDDKGRKVIVSQGIGDSLWGAFRIVGPSLKRIKSIPMAFNRETAIKLLDRYAEKHGWKKVDE